ncbi:uncharacterized protein L201_006576 [Kwoniella dendrophila CBS 6074]|uniref:DUF6534 domain-containing protein n=1 Tax=Kwoniella dendrophila CBS 6074 TaxID=1295534 RepID=A0AAX4K1Z3_9TREE
MASMTPDQLAVAMEAAAKASIDSHHNLNLGTFFVASATDTLLCGIMMVQLINYWTWSKEDRWFNKSIVIVTAISSFVATIFIIVLMFRLFVYNFGTYYPFAALNLLTYMSIIDIIPSVATQIFFAERAYKLNNRSMTLLIAISICLLASICGAVGFPPARGARNMATGEGQQKAVAFMYLWLCGSLGADLLITGSIMWSLLRSKTGWKETDDTITRLIAIMVETQLPPTLVVIFFFIVTFGVKDTYLDIFALWVQSKFYTCGLLASLNSRYSLRRTMRSETSSRGRTSRTAPVIHVLTETYVQRDAPSSLTSPTQSRATTLRPTFSHKVHRGIAKDPLDIDDDSIELEEKTPQTPTSHSGQESSSSSAHIDLIDEYSQKLDYIENESRTALTGDLTQGK